MVYLYLDEYKLAEYMCVFKYMLYKAVSYIILLCLSKKYSDFSVKIKLIFILLEQ